MEGPKMSEEFEGKVVIVTGAASGIGRATALAFGEKGTQVVVADIQVTKGENTARMIKDAGGEAIFIEADVRSAASVEALVEKTILTYGRLDFAHNNAGIEDEVKFTADCTEENWDNIINTNLKGVWLCMKYEIPQMIKQGGGAIVNTASTAGMVSIPGWPAYGASKGGVIQLTRTAAVEYALKGIRVNAVCPGGVRTALQKRVMLRGADTSFATAADLNPLERMAAPGEIAEVVVWLCSSAASFVTGHSMVADGGQTAR